MTLSESLNDSVSVYRDIKSATTGFNSFDNILQEIISLPSSSKALLPPLLAIAETLGFEAAASSARVLVDVFVRHTLILGRDNSALENNIYVAARELRVDRSSEQFIAKLRELRHEDEAVREAFARLSVSHNGFRRYLLVKIEADIRRTEEVDVAAPDRVHVEHIYPQNPPMDRRLPRHSDLINRIGNLTLLSARLNRQIQNSGFRDKKPAFEQSELMLSSELSRYEQFGIEEINERQQLLADRVAQIWNA